MTADVGTRQTLQSILQNLTGDHRTPVERRILARKLSCELRVLQCSLEVYILLIDLVRTRLCQSSPTNHPSAVLRMDPSILRLPPAHHDFPPLPNLHILHRRGNRSRSRRQALRRPLAHATPQSPDGRRGYPVIRIAGTGVSGPRGGASDDLVYGERWMGNAVRRGCADGGGGWCGEVPDLHDAGCGASFFLWRVNIPGSQGARRQLLQTCFWWDMALSLPATFRFSSVTGRILDRMSQHYVG